MHLRRLDVSASATSPPALAGFHPAVRAWFQSTFEMPTPAQVRGWPAIREGRHTLVAAPTGSGKTLAAFLSTLDELLQEGLRRCEADEDGLPDETRVVYVSPLKALSADVHRNLAEPRRGIRLAASEMGLPEVRITAAVRSGDTPQRERQAMIRRPPHVLVTTPESLYLLLTAERSRAMLRTVRTVIVDEIHAVIESRRGAHLALSLERLDHIAGREVQRVGLSATQTPIEDVARFLVGAGGVDPTGSADCSVVDEGHLRTLELALEVPRSPLETVLSGEVWEEIYDRLAELAGQHRTTLVFVNTRRLAERVAHNLSPRLGEDAVAAHHGSLSRETRLDAERRLSSGDLRVLVATASLELGIDIGHVDLVCQLGSPHRISAFLQRVGRSGHTVGGTPRGRLFPLSRDDLVECAALMRAVGKGRLDRLRIPPGPLDVLAQQVVAESAAEDWDEAALYGRLRRAWPYRELPRADFDAVVEMAARGFTTRRGRRRGLVHHDGVNGRVRGRKGARLAAITAGGAIPDTADYRVILEPAGLFLGTVNEDFAVESMAGDVFQLGNASWRILRVQEGAVRVEDASGERPSIPFWLGEAPSRSDELCAEVAALRGEIDAELEDAGGEEAVARRLALEDGVGESAAFQLVTYLADGKRILGALPTLDTLVLERFFDEAGGMQLILHAPFGSRVNRAWGLALRKRFCRQFNFELQAAATEEAILLSLGPQHSFPLDDVFRYLAPETVREVLVQALLDSPMFQTRWRWAATLSLALLRWRNGRKTPAPIQRMEAEDLLAAVFPDAAACLENVAGDREVPDHPLVRQAVDDCLHEAMDVERLEELLGRIRAGELRLVSRDTPEPSALAAEILNARPYAFLDDAPLEERRARAVYTRRALEPSAAKELGELDQAAIDKVREEAWPTAETPDELHDALLTSGFLIAEEGERTEAWPTLLGELAEVGRAARVWYRASPPVFRAGQAQEPGSGESAAEVGRSSRPVAPSRELWVAAERLGELELTLGEQVRVDLTPSIEPVGAVPETPGEALKELLRSRLEILGPVSAGELEASLGAAGPQVEQVLLALEAEGVVLRGTFTPSRDGEEWCERRLLARIHRYTLDRLRAEIQPVAPATFMRFLFRWQHVEVGQQLEGPEGLAAVLRQLDGYEVPAVSWETDVLASRVADYDPSMLDGLCLAGRAAWGRLSPPPEGERARRVGPLRNTPVAIFLREHRRDWLALAAVPPEGALSEEARAVLAIARARGASFFDDLVAGSGLLATSTERAVGELVALGWMTSDGFSGLRALLTPSERRPSLSGSGSGSPRRAKRRGPWGVHTAGRWSLLPDGSAPAPDTDGSAPRPLGRPWERSEAEAFARALLRRYGVVFRRLLDREPLAPPWRDLVLVYRRLEAWGEVRGGRFVERFTGEQFALPEAVPMLRKVRREDPSEDLLVVSAADPLNLTGVITAGERIAVSARVRIGYRAGVPALVRENGDVRVLGNGATPIDPQAALALVRRRIPPGVRSYAGQPR